MTKNSNHEIINIDEETQVSFKVFQDVYNTVTGKTESITQLYYKPYLIEKNDIDQLDLKIIQICDQYNIKAQNCSVTIYHTQGTKEVFSSYKRFGIYNTSNTVPIENILLEYDFLILLPQLTKPQTYKLSINLPSRTGILNKASTESSIPIEFIRMMMMTITGRVKIQYVDYTVTRTFQTHIDEWFKSLKQSKKIKGLSTIQSYSHHIRRLIYVSIPILFLAYASKSILNTDADLPPDNIISQLATLSSITIALFAFGYSFGKFIELSIDKIQPISYVKLNRGDEECANKASSQNMQSFMKIIIGIIGTIGIGLLTTVLSNWIGLDNFFQ